MKLFLKVSDNNIINFIYKMSQQKIFNITTPNNETFQSAGPAWVLRNSQNLMYVAGASLLIIFIMILMFYYGYLSYGKTVEKPTPAKPILKQNSSQSPPPTDNKKKAGFDNSIENEIDDINASQASERF
jgi:hypothetical protein